ncbi:MAG: hypothetical protein QOE58_415, partial [Actinomycetota bacterium]|nr:hypothetical protein [Actinomycetota bacterium]
EATSSPRDTLKVRAGPTVLQTLSNANAALGYQLKTVDLSAYSGRTIVLSFTDVEGDGAATSFLLDDTSVTSWQATPSTAIFSPLDFTGDHKSDVMRVTPAGELYLYRGNGLGAFSGPGTKIGSGWGGFARVFSPGDFTGDGKSDILAVKTNGDLYVYRGSGLGGFTGAATKVSAGWAGFSKVFSPGDFTGDGRSDVMAVLGSGDLFLFRGNGQGGFTGRATRIGTGWGGFAKVFSPGDFTGDGRSDIMAVGSNGDLHLYRGNGIGGFWGAGTKIGAGWAMFVSEFSPRDFTGDGRSDVLGVQSTGRLYLYRGNGLGGFVGSGVRITPALS